MDPHHPNSRTPSKERLKAIGNKINIRSEHQDKVMMQLMRTWLYTHDKGAMMCPKVEPMIKRLVGLVRRLLDEFCTTYSPDDLLVVVFLYADKFIERVGFVDKAHLSGILISSVVVTVKFHEDKGLYNSWVAAACNLSRRDIHHMERVFLTTLSYELMLSSSQINKFFSTHNKAWEEKSSLYAPPSPKSAPRSRSKPSLSESPPTARHTSSRVLLSTTRHTPSSSSKTKPSSSSSSKHAPQPSRVPSTRPSTKSKSVSNPSSPSTTHPIAIRRSTTQPATTLSSHRSSSRPSHISSHPSTLTSKPSTLTSKPSTTSNTTKPPTKLSKVTKAYKVLSFFKICVPV